MCDLDEGAPICEKETCVRARREVQDLEEQISCISFRMGVLQEEVQSYREKEATILAGLQEKTELETRVQIAEQKVTDLQAVLAKFQEEEVAKVTKTLRAVVDQLAENRSELIQCRQSLDFERTRGSLAFGVVKMLPKCEDACGDFATGCTAAPDSEYRCDGHAIDGNHFDLPYAAALRRWLNGPK